MKFGKEFLNMTQKVEVIKEIDKLGIQNLKILLSGYSFIFYQTQQVVVS